MKTETFANFQHRYEQAEPEDTSPRSEWRETLAYLGDQELLIIGDQRDPFTDKKVSDDPDWQAEAEERNLL